MEFDPKDIRLERRYLGPGSGSSLTAVHLPTGLSVTESIPATSDEPSRLIQLRLVSALKLKLAKKTSDERA